jgi:hypothetical protein
MPDEQTAKERTLPASRTALNFSIKSHPALSKQHRTNIPPTRSHTAQSQQHSSPEKAHPKALAWYRYLAGSKRRRIKAGHTRRLVVFQHAVNKPCI